MTWYCGNCHFMNSVNDLYCCHCQRIKDEYAFRDGGLPPIAPSAGPLQIGTFGYSTHDDGNHEHYKASLSNDLDLDLASIDATSAPAQDPRDGKRRKFWYCCYCGDGPHGAGNIPACNCEHLQCKNCNVVMLKKNSAR